MPKGSGPENKTPLWAGEKVCLSRLLTESLWGQSGVFPKLLIRLAAYPIGSFF